MNRKLVVAVLVLILLSALFIKIRASLPVVRAEGESLSWENYSKHKNGLLRFRDLNKETIRDEDIERGVILAFVEDEIIRKELERRGKREDDVRRVVTRTVTTEDFKKLQSASAQLYGWTISDFEKFILYPQARRILLTEEQEKGKTNPAKWLEKSFKEANISVYLLKWKWKDGEMIRRF